MNLAYGRDVPPALLELCEHHARRLGLPLNALERVGQSIADAEGFIVAAERGLGTAYAMSIVYGEPLPDTEAQAVAGAAADSAVPA